MNEACNPTNYAVLVFDPDRFTGKVSNVKRNGQRRCRFCGRVLDEFHFQKEAHAISVSLGNTKFICTDECDECNENFGSRLENDVARFFQVHLELSQVPKRNGKMRQVHGRNFEMKMSDEVSSFTTLPTLCFQLDEWKDDNMSTDKVVGMMNSLDLSNQTYVPQNIYKAFCKYALSLMPQAATLQYQKTIQWIREDFFEPSLPKVKVATVNREGKDPKMCIFLRKTPGRQFPRCVVSLCVTHIQFFYLLPFCDESGGAEADNALFDAFWEQFSKYVPAALFDQFRDQDFSSSNRMALNLDVDLTIEPGAAPIRLKREDETENWVLDEETGNVSEIVRQ